MKIKKVVLGLHPSEAFPASSEVHSAAPTTLFPIKTINFKHDYFQNPVFYLLNKNKNNIF